ncbi:hypothetical protein [Rhodoferax sp.]|uniref:hypothetical protein n=1 Tax=Rhodoferax sp. TaxID=50421 RepID=UPI0026196ECB|nr:hypothetical protein [Rhodoferax sp.]MDD2809280.1 hypothetical protein [Rhodoferax sp.]
MTHNTQQKAPRACDSEGLLSDTNVSDFRSHAPIGQAHDVYFWVCEIGSYAVAFGIGVILARMAAS